MITGKEFVELVKLEYPDMEEDYDLDNLSFLFKTVTTLSNPAIVVDFALAVKYLSPNGIFNTDSFRAVVGIGSLQNDIAIPVIVAALSSNPRIVRLSGGHHWMILPDNRERYVEEKP